MRRMLIVDDNPDICECLGHFFRARGFSVVLTLSGEEAIDHIQHDPVDVILIDILLPGMHGIEVLKRVKELCPAIKAIMVTALSHEESRLEATAYGADGYVTKPFDFSDLTWDPVLSNLP